MDMKTQWSYSKCRILYETYQVNYIQNFSANLSSSLSLNFPGKKLKCAAYLIGNKYGEAQDLSLTSFSIGDPFITQNTFSHQMSTLSNIITHHPI